MCFSHFLHAINFFFFSFQHFSCSNFLERKKEHIQRSNCLAEKKGGERMRDRENSMQVFRKNVEVLRKFLKILGEYHICGNVSFSIFIKSCVKFSLMGLGQSSIQKKKKKNKSKRLLMELSLATENRKKCICV